MSDITQNNKVGQLEPINEPTPNYYALLHISTTASRSEVREAYIRMRHTFGGKSQALYSLFDEEEAQQMMARFEEAYRVLDDELRRAQYDRKLGLNVAHSLVVDDEMVVQVEPDLSSEGKGHKWPMARSTEHADNMINTNENNELSDKPAVKKAPPVARKASDELRDKMNELIDQSEDIGDGGLFCSLRELAGASQEELQERTKVCIEYIRAIEENAYKKLPQSVFVKGFLRSYLKYLAAPRAEEMVAAFAKRLDECRLETGP